MKKIFGKKCKCKLWLIALISVVACVLAYVFLLPKKVGQDTDPSAVVSSYVSQRDAAINEYLLSQKNFSWKTQTGTTNFCVFEDLEPENELFPMYVWVRCGEFVLRGNDLKELSGVSTPAVIDYPNELSFFDTKRLTHKVPGDGSKYLADVKSLFPAEISEKVLNYDAGELTTKLNNLAKKILAENASKKVITVKGKVVCLAHKDTKGPQTEECAIGIQDDMGTEYGISDPEMKFIPSMPSGKMITVTGMYKKTINDKYKAIGTIEIQRVEGEM